MNSGVTGVSCNKICAGPQDLDAKLAHILCHRTSMICEQITYYWMQDTQFHDTTRRDLYSFHATFVIFSSGLTDDFCVKFC